MSQQLICEYEHVDLMTFSGRKKHFIVFWCQLKLFYRLMTVIIGSENIVDDSNWVECEKSQLFRTN